jgi:hypothetical protein
MSEKGAREKEKNSQETLQEKNFQKPLHTFKMHVLERLRRSRYLLTER